MKVMRNFAFRVGLAAALSFWLGLLLSPSPVSAESQTAVRIDTPAEIGSGGEFVARVAITGVTGFDATNYDITYNTSVLQVIGSEGGAIGVTVGLIGTTAVPVDVWGFVPSGTPGKIRVIQNIPGVDGVSGSGYLVEIHFRVVGAVGTSSDITLSNGTLSDKNAQQISATWTGGLVRVGTQKTTGAIQPSPPMPVSNSGPSAPAAPSMPLPSVSGSAPSDAPKPPLLSALGVDNIILSFVGTYRIWLILGLAGVAILTAVVVLLTKAAAQD